MTVVVGLLAISDHRAGPGFPAAKASVLHSSHAGDPIFRTEHALDRDRWKGIVIHHSGEPAGDADSIRRLHVSRGARMMGYHFVIGNGNGMSDGLAHVGERWIRQLPGWHAVGPNAEFYNQHTIAICLVGNGDRRPFSERQTTQLISLVRRLQRELAIPPSAVRLHRDVAADLTTSPGRHFPTAVLDRQLLNPLR